MSIVDQVAKQFSSGELVQTAECMGLSPTSRWGSKRITEAILAYIKTNGVPKPVPGREHSGLMEEFLYVAGLVDKGGVVQDASDTKKTLEQFVKDIDLLELPDCYGYQDDIDPVCKTCKLGPYCAEERLSNLAPCYGLLYDSSNIECSKCFDAPMCKPQ